MTNTEMLTEINARIAAEMEMESVFTRELINKIKRAAQGKREKLTSGEVSQLVEAYYLSDDTNDRGFFMYGNAQIVLSKKNLLSSL